MARLITSCLLMAALSACGKDPAPSAVPSQADTATPATPPATAAPATPEKRPGPAAMAASPSETAQLDAARATRLGLARFVPATSTVLTVDGRPWIGMRRGETALPLAPVEPIASGAECVPLPEGGGFWFFESSPPAALRLAEDAQIYWLSADRACWTRGTLSRAAPTEVVGRDTWRVTADDHDDGETKVAPRVATVRGPALPKGAQVSAKVHGEGVHLELRVAPEPADPWAALDVEVASDDGSGGEYPSARRGDLTVRGTRDGRLEVVFVDSLEFGDQGAPWIKARVEWAVRVAEKSATSLSSRWSLSYGYGGDGSHTNNKLRGRTGASPLPRGSLLGEVEVIEPYGQDNASPTGELGSASQRRHRRVAWGMVDDNGDTLPLWPDLDAATGVAPPGCGLPLERRVDQEGVSVWRGEPTRARRLPDVSEKVVAAARLDPDKEPTGLPGEVTTKALHCGTLLTHTISVRGTSVVQVERDEPDDNGDIVTVDTPVRGEGRATLVLLVDPVTLASWELTWRLDASWEPLTPAK